MQRFVFYIIFILGAYTSEAQQVFEGKISYVYGSPGLTEGSAVYFFSSKNIRIDVHFPHFPGEKNDSTGFASQLYFSDNKLVYIIDHQDKTIKKIFIDSMPPDESPAIGNVLPGQKVINGYTCFGIETRITQEINPTDSIFQNDSGIHVFSIKQRSWYAKDLVTPIGILFPQLFAPMIDNRRICLRVEGTSFMDDDSSDMNISFFANKIEPGIQDESVFSVPGNYKLIEMKASDLIKDSSFNKVELLDIKQVETNEPPPPPPPPKPVRKTGKLKTQAASARKPVKSTGSTQKGIQ